MLLNQILTIEKVNLSDLEEIKKLQPEGWTDISSEFEFYINSSYCYPVKIAIDEKVIGVGSAIILGKTSWLAHIITDVNHRNQGIGQRMVNVLLRYLKSNSIDTFLLIATELGLPVYSKLGFRVVSDYLFFKRDKPWTHQPHSNRIVSYNSSFYMQVMDLDRIATGEIRGALLYNYLPSSYLYVENNKVKGFYVPDLRDGPIIARTGEAGLELMRFKYAKVDKAVIPAENSAGVNFLLKNGFKVTDTKGTRMILGNNIIWRPEMIFSRISGNFG